MAQGLIVKLRISRWRAKAKLDFDKLGLTFVNDDSLDFMKKYVSLGTQKLLPPAEMGAMEVLERRARNNLKSYSFDTIWGRFVPMTAFDEWKANNDAIYEDFKEFELTFVDRYDEIKIGRAHV